MDSDTRRYSERETLKDGRGVTVRAIRHEDREALAEAFRDLDRESIYRRFFTPKRDLSERELEALTDVDFAEVVALVATLQGEHGEALIGGGRYALIGDGVAEVAFVTGGQYRGLGVAGLILKHLTQIARTQGVRRFEAEVLAENQPMLAAFRRSGLRTHSRREGSVVLVTLELGEAGTG